MDDKKYFANATLNYKDPKINDIEKEYMQQIQQQNLERFEKLKRIRAKNRYLGIGLAVSVLGIYAYTITSIKQEKFLDDFNEPEKSK